MTRPLLPPRGVYVPARMIYDNQLPPALILTWIQLRGLAWGGMVTPPLRMTGTCRSHRQVSGDDLWSHVPAQAYVHP